MCVCRYLQEVGYTDTILDVRTQRVRSLLGLAASEQNGSVENKNLQQLINGTEPCKEQRYTHTHMHTHTHTHTNTLTPLWCPGVQGTFWRPLTSWRTQRTVMRTRTQI